MRTRAADFDEDTSDTSQVKIGLTYDAGREALVVCIDQAKGLKALGNTPQCKTVYVKAAMLPCAQGESCVLETKPCDYQENPEFGEQFHIPLAEVRQIRLVWDLSTESNMLKKMSFEWSHFTVASGN